LSPMAALPNPQDQAYRRGFAKRKAGFPGRSQHTAKPTHSEATQAEKARQNSG